MNMLMQPNELWNLDVILAVATLAMTLVLMWPRQTKSCSREQARGRRL